MAISVLVVGAGVALSSSLGILGYNGTTGLQMTPKTDWNEFRRTYFKGTQGAPYEFNDSEKPRETSDKMVYFDKRLVTLLTYLAQRPANAAVCPAWPKGTTRTPDKIGLSVFSAAGVDSDLYTPADNISSVSTIYRGVGLRITGRDKIKCSQKDLSTGIISAFDEFNIIFDKGNNFLDHLPDKPYNPATTLVTCAVNYYPGVPTNITDIVDIDEWGAETKNPPERSSMPWGELMPDTDAIPYLAVTNYAKTAALYKMIETVYQILDIDQNGCYSSITEKKLGKSVSCDADGKNCSAKMPFTIVLPNWVVFDPTYGIKKKNTPVDASGGSTNIWNDLTKTAKENYLIDLQSVNRSPLAGISWDPSGFDSAGNPINYTSKLEDLHLNY